MIWCGLALLCCLQYANLSLQVDSTKIHNTMLCRFPRRTQLLRSVNRDISVCASRSFATFPVLRHASPIHLNQLDKKWIPKWRSASPDNSLNPAKSAVSPDAQPFYCLSMFPYPSGNLHLGHQRVYTISDALARYKRLQGYNVIHPMGWDAFGLPAENAAVERGINPALWTELNVAKMKDQMHAMLADFDWEREVNTSAPEYFKWTQKIFTLLFERGLAYRMGAEINWDPVDQTVLANEQVDADGRSWRSGAVVEKRTLEQWFIGITKYAEQLQDDLRQLDQWPDKVKAMQKNWIGKSHGAEIKFRSEAGDEVAVFTSRPDTLFSVQFVAVALNHPLVTKTAQKDAKLAAFIAEAAKIDDPTSKAGFRLDGLKLSLPLSVEGEKQQVYDIPVFAAPYVIGTYGHGAVMGCPAHDERDADFWNIHCPGIPARQTVGHLDAAEAALLALYTAKEGRLYDLKVLPNGVESLGVFSGLTCSEAAKKITATLETLGAGGKSTQFKIRDWLISRQRYWGAPIPIIHCDSCGPVAVPDEDLPVLLPAVDGQGFGKGNPLATIDSFVNTTCPSCGSAAKRETDTMDTFIDSSWYFFRYTDPHNQNKIFDFDKASKHMPVDLYLGGVEHAILHLMYSRFISKFLGDAGLWDGKAFMNEPIKRLVTQGMVHGETFTDPDTGRFLKPDELDFSSGHPVIAATSMTPRVSFEKMSKSKFNGVDPVTCISKYGADAVRANILFSAPVTDVLNWNEDQIQGVERWLKKVLRLKEQVLLAYTSGLTSNKENGQEVPNLLLNDVLHKSYRLNEQELALYNEIQTYTQLIAKSVEDVSMNTIISDFMKMTNTLQRVFKEGQDIDPQILLDSYKKLLIVMAPATPSVAEECWEGVCHGLGQEWKSVFFQKFPVCEPIVSLSITFKVIVNGKNRGAFKSEKSLLQLPEDELLNHVYANTDAEKFVAGKAIKKMIAKEGIISINTCK